VYVHLTQVSDPVIRMLRLHGLDIEIVNARFAIVQGWIQPAALEALAAEPAVVKIRPASYGATNGAPHAGVTAVTTQGDSIHRCNQARTLGVSGSGIEVGVLSGGVAGLASAQAAGELPSVVQVISSMPGDDEGTALLEIVHDCAPGAALAFASTAPTGTITSLAFMQALDALTEAGAHIVVDDVGFFAEPYFEDGVLAQHDRVVGSSIVRISAAGNQGQFHYQGAFAPAQFDTTVPRPGLRHAFAGSDTLLRFRIAAAPGGALSTIILQWANRFGDSADDYDLCIRQTSGALIGCSMFVQDGGDDPIEFVPLVCVGPSGAVCAGDIQINLVAGVARIMEIYCIGACGVMDQFNVRVDSILGGPASVPEVITVGAIPASNPATIESYSSAGPVTLFFPQTEFRNKPDVTATDCVSTSRPSFATFCGTSAPAPHVAGVAALVMQAMGASATPAAVRQVLKSTAIDLGAPGFDYIFGFGRVDALSGVQSIAPSLAAAVLPGSRSVRANVTATAFASIVASGFGTATACAITPLTGVQASFLYQRTDPSTNAPIGVANTPVTIAAGHVQTFLIAFTPTQSFSSTDVKLSFDCSNTDPAPILSGVNTLLLSASSDPTPDIVALGATLSGDGIVDIVGASGTGVLSVATVNVGASATITATVDTGGANLPVSLRICQTDPANGQCINPTTPGASATVQINAGDTPTFSVFVRGDGSVAFLPGVNRAFVRFKTTGGTTVGATSVALRTQ
jgi:subtilisin family serine protease